MKQKVKVLLYNISYRADMPNKAFVPLSFVLLEEYLSTYGTDIETLRYDYIIDDPTIKEFSAYNRYDIVGFSLTFANADYIMRLIRQWEEIGQRPFVVVGGVLASAIAMELLNEVLCIDVVVVGEGEQSLLELTNVISGNTELKNVPGIVYRDQNKKIKYTHGKEPINFDLVPISRREELKFISKEELSRTPIRIQTARGCLGNCSFCSNSYRHRLDKITTKRWRGMSPEHVVRQIKNLRNNYGVQLINFVDPSFEDPGMKGKKRIREIANLLLEQDLRISFKVNMRAETFTDNDDDLLWLLKRAGMDIIVLGIEASTNKELKMFGKNADIETIRNSYLRLKSMDCFSIHVGYMQIHPYSTIDTLKKSSEYLYGLGLAHSFDIFRSVLIPLRGTNIYDQILKDDLISNPENAWGIPQCRFQDHRVAKMNNEIQMLKIRNPILSDLFQINFDAHNILARSQNRIFDDMISNHKIGTAYGIFKNEIDSVTNDLNERYHDIQRMLIQIIENERIDMNFQDFLSKSILDDALGIHSRIRNAIEEYIQIVKQEHDISIFQSKSWGSYCMEKIRMGVGDEENSN